MPQEEIYSWRLVLTVLLTAALIGIVHQCRNPHYHPPTQGFPSLEE